MCLADFLFQGIVDGEESTTAELLEQVLVFICVAGPERCVACLARV